MIARLRSDPLLRDSLMVMIATMLSNGFIFLFYVIMARLLDIAEYGEMYALVGLSVLAMVPGTILNPVITKFAAEAHADGDAAQVRALARFVGLVFLWLSAIYVLVGALAAVPLGWFFHVPAWAIFFTAFVTGGFAFSTAARAFVQGRHDFLGYSVATTIDGSARVLFGGLLVVGGLGVGGALGGLLVAGVLGTGYAIGRIAPVVRAASRQRLQLNWRRVAATAYGAAVAAGCVALLSYGDIAIVKHFFDANAAGIYSAVSLDGKIMFFLVNFAPAVLLPKVVDQFGRGQSTRGTLFGVLALVAAMSLLGLAVFAFEPGLIVDVLNGGKFAAATPYLWGYAGAMALLGVTNVLATYAIGIHRMAFGIPFLVVSLGGLGAIAIYHPSIGAVVGLLVAVNAAALLAVAVAVALGGPTATGPLESVAIPPVG